MTAFDSLYCGERVFQHREHLVDALDLVVRVLLDVLAEVAEHQGVRVLLRVELVDGELAEDLLAWPWARSLYFFRSSGETRRSP